jgi:hypothetical protein
LETEYYTWINGEFTWAKVEKTGDIMKAKYELAIRDTDSLSDEATFGKGFMSATQKMFRGERDHI